METISFAIGSNSTHIYSTPKFSARNNLPKELEANWKNVATVVCTAFGPKENAWVVGYIDLNNIFRIAWGDGLPKALVSWIRKPENCQTQDLQLQIALGPDDSFFAWNSSSIRWSNIPAGFEKDLQEEWLSPSGWLKGPPKIVALGSSGIYFAVSQHGSISASLEPHGLYNTLAKWFKTDGFSLRSIKHLVLSPVHNSSYIIIRDDSVYEYDLPDDYLTPSFFTVIDSLADDATQRVRFMERENARVEKIQKELEYQEFQNRQREAKADEEQAEKAQREAAAEERRRSEDSKREQREKEFFDQQERQKAAEEQATKAREDALQAELSRIYSAWKTECDTRFSSSCLLTVFPSVPRKACFCTEPACSFDKNTEGSLTSCRHDMERLLRASGLYTLNWLRKGRLVWHPDRFGQKCDPDHRVTLCQKSTEMFAIFSSLIDDERERVTRTTI